MINNFIQTLLGICFLRKGPQDLPAANQWLIIASAMFLGINLISILQSKAFYAIFASILQMLVTAGFIFLVLKSKNLQTRHTQTLTAVFGCSAIIMLLVTLLGFFMPDSQLPDDAPLEALINESPKYFSTIAIISLWGFAIDGHIFRHAFNTSFGKGLLWAFALYCTIFVSYIIGIV